jgi:hypothetical protein
MQGLELKILLTALSLGAVATAGAQTYVPASPDSANSPSQPLLLVVPADAVVPADNALPPDTSTRAPVIVPSATEESTVILLVPAAPTTEDGRPSGIDPRADAKCRNAAVGSYWDCVNSYNGN